MAAYLGIVTSPNLYDVSTTAVIVVNLSVVSEALWGVGGGGAGWSSQGV